MAKTLYLSSVPSYRDFAPHNMTGASTPSPYVASGYSTYQPPWKVFDGLNEWGGACWQGYIPAGSTFITLDLGTGAAKTLAAYAIKTANNGWGTDSRSRPSP